ncbi:hypothetical protein LPJ53_004080 [Coemansia erecta]|uniref:Kinesin motor domain-containing protein n=1 Tax=Coemansia erecta TaxID=147472 RepID=A0A9W7XZU3_9FUNG|nr:hypothetical protein LPJ53_004080 [Coemansia erecta]
MDDHINVAIRVRPLNQRELRTATTAGSAQQIPWTVQRDTITQRISGDGRLATGNSFTFDKVFDQKDTTQKVYDDIVKNIITSSMGGFNGTIFAYGQTSSGKTHTMYGGASELGIVKLAVNNMFSIVENDSKREYLIRVSFLEIYNEVLRDLLEPSKTNLKIHENAKHEIFVGDLSEHIVFNTQQVEEILAKGDGNRQIGGTNMNERSSRSHTIFRIVIESREKADSGVSLSESPESSSKADSSLRQQQRLSTGSAAESSEFTGAVMVSCLNLVDLAGSERVGQTGAEGQRLKEGAHINRSLLSLGTVIARLSEDGGDRGHIPYRDSKITRILQPSLGGNAKTLIICTMTPSPDYVEEALSTLKFASRAKTIKNKPEVNEELRGDALLRRLKRASELEKEVAQMKEIERKKLKIEADNESLLRQLWKSQKERDRLQRELVKQQSSVFLPRQIADSKDAADNASVIRRQTWFPGLLVPITENDSSTDDTQQESLSPQEVDAGTTMDVDTAANNLPPRDQSAATVSKELHQIALDRISELAIKGDLLQQQHSEMSRASKEMEDTIQRHMREYNLLLSTLNQLAAADVIPPSPAKGEPLSSSQPPRELAQIRRKLRALMTTIGASQRMCQKFRSQRPEADFLEMELQATRETLIQKEEELVEVMRESDELFSRFSRAEEDYAKLQEETGQMRTTLGEASSAQLVLENARTALAAQLEQDRQQYSTELQSLKTQAASEMQMATDSLRSEITALETKSAEQIGHIESLTAKLSSRELALQNEIESSQALVRDHQSTITKLLAQLADSVSGIDELKGQCERLTTLTSDASNKESEIARLKTVVDELNVQAAAYTEIISTLESKSAAQESTIGERSRETEQLNKQLSSLTKAMEALELQIVESESAHSIRISDYKSELDSLQSAYAQERQELEHHLTERDALAKSMRSDIDSLTDQIAATNEALSSATAELSCARQQADRVPVLNTEMARLQIELSAAVSDRISLLADLDTIKQERDDIVGEHKRACAKNEELEGQNADIWDRISELTVSNNDLSTKLLQSEQDVVDRVARIKVLESSVLAAEEHSASLQADINQMVSSHRSELAGTEHTTADVRQKLQLSEEHLATKQAEWKLLLSERDSLIASAETKLETTISEYEQQLDALRAGSREASGEAEVLRGKLDSAHSQLESLRRDVAEAATSKSMIAKLNTDLSIQLEDKSMAVQNLEEQVRALRNEAQNAVTTAEQTQGSHEAHLNDLKAKHAIACSDLAVLQKERDDLVQRLRDQEALADRLSKSAEDSAEQLQQLHEAHRLEVAELQLQIDSLVTCREQALQDSANAKDEHDAAVSQMDNIKAALADAESRYSDLSRQHESLLVDMSTARADVLSKLEELDAARKHAVQLESVADSYKAQLELTQGKNGELQKRICELETDVQRISAERETADDITATARRAAEDQIVSLKHAIAAQSDDLTSLQQQLSEAVETRDTAVARMAELEAAAEQSLASEKISADRLAMLENSLGEQQELVSSLRSCAAQVESEFATDKEAAAKRISLLEMEIGQLGSRISDGALEAESLSRKLEDAIADSASACAARESAAAECHRLQSEFDMLAERSKESQLRLEQEVSEARHNLSNNDIVIEGLEHALETANASLSASQARAQDEALATIEELEGQVAKYKAELSAVQAALGDCPAVEQLVQERDRALKSIDTLKAMMIELASSKDGDIAELEESLKQQEALLEASVRETVEKEEALQLSEKLSATHLDRAVKAETELDQATRNSASDIERLVRERDELDGDLKRALSLEDKLRKDKSEADSELLGLRAAIVEHQQTTLDLEKKVDQLSDELAKTQVDVDAGTNLAMTMRAELQTLIKKLATLPGCQSEDTLAVVQDNSLASHEDLFKHALSLISVATVSTSESAADSGVTSDELTHVQQEIERLRVLNDKLEKKNAKLREVYKQDITELHAEEEKQRKRADALSAEMGSNAAHIQALEQQLVEVRGELETQQKQRIDLETTVVQLTTKSNSLQRVRTLEMPNTPQKSASPLVSTPENTSRNGNSNLTASNTKAAMTRLASQRTPMKTENKRVNTTPKPESMLSPISSSVLNARLAASAAQEEALPLTGRYPLRKRTAVNSENNSAAVAVAASPVSTTSVSADLAAAATKTEAARGRSTYGDRRRNRRNQPAARSDDLDGQAAEQCAQQ